MPAPYSLDPRDPRPARGAATLVGLALLLAMTAAGLLTVAGPPRLPTELPAWDVVLATLRGSTPPLAALRYLAVTAAWLLWLWLAGSLGIQLLLAAAEVAARGAGWVATLRAVADRVTAPIARRAVTAAFVVQVVGRSVPLASAAPLPPPEPVTVVASPDQLQAETTGHAIPQSTAAATTTTVAYHVQPGDTLWGISQRFYGTGDEYRRLIDANVGRQMADGRRFSRQAVIRPGWVLSVPLPGDPSDSPKGQHWYTVEKGDTLRSIAARLLGDEAEWTVLYDRNRGVASAPDGQTLATPNLIWPGMRLAIPSEPLSTDANTDPDRVDPPVAASAADLPPTRLEPVAQPTPPTAPAPAVADAGPQAEAVAAAASDADRQAQPGLAGDTVAPGVAADSSPAPAAVPAGAAEAADVPDATPVGDPLASPPASDIPLPAAALGGLGLALLGAGGAVWGRRRLRRPRRVKTEPESDVVVEEGYATAELAHELAHRLQGDEADPVQVVVAQLTRFLAEHHLETASVVAARHGRSATTLTLAAPIADQARLLEMAAAFGQRIGVGAETWVSPDHDVLLRLSGLRRARLLAPAGDGAASTPWLLPIGVLYSRQILYVDWHALGHVLVAGVQGQGADTVLTSLLAILTARRQPRELRLLTIAAPRSLPAPIAALPHQNQNQNQNQSAASRPVVDPADKAAVTAALEEVRAELETRIGRAERGEPRRGSDIVVVLGELAALDDQVASLDLISTHGPAHGVRLLAATSDPDGLQSPLLPHLTTRLVLQTADEDASMALLGLNDAAFLGGGGRLLLRIDSREPIELYGYRVASDHLERLVRLMGDAYSEDERRPPRDLPHSPITPAAVAPPAESSEPETESETEAVSEWAIPRPASPPTAVRLLEPATAGDVPAASSGSNAPAAEGGEPVVFGADDPPDPGLALYRPRPTGASDAATPLPPASNGHVHETEAKPESTLLAPEEAEASGPPDEPDEPDEVRNTALETARSSSVVPSPAAAVEPPTTEAVTVSTEPPLSVVCFGGPSVRYRGRQVWPAPGSGDAKPWEVLVFVACQPPEGATREALAHALWPDDTRATDPGHRLRQLRYRLRNALDKLAPGITGDVVRADASGIYRLDQTIVQSDAQRFLALYKTGRTSCGAEAIAAYEEARVLYTGDLLDGPDARRYAWVDDRDDSGVMLQEHFRRVHHQLTFNLADLYASAGQTDGAIALYRELAQADPGDESIWRALFRLHHRRRDRPALLREERRMRQALRESDPDDAGDLGLDPDVDPEVYEPSAETAFEFDRLLADLGGRGSAAVERRAAAGNGVVVSARDHG